ncbi:hypothetical protein VNI00_012702 [Paramarasmius palmivorus]|uniref:NACHT domain-containing protein n=1 Tax=Paramarasmius palmivorus TaxID=297713 RepID=A0AAW0C5M7_9AGAR
MIADISNWIEDNSKTTRVLWIHGTAGIGKSAIAQHIAEKYAETRLAAAFFFSRNDPTRDNINPFIASIAYQLCKVGSLSHPMLCSKIIEAISVNLNVFQASCEVQLRNLIIEPCLRVDPPSWNVERNLLVIDGLDECVDLPSQKRVLELILRLISAVFPSSWIVLLCSRPESQIRDAIEQIRSFKGFLKAIDMNKQEELHSDIARYLTDESSRIRREHRRVLGIQGAVWPGNDVIVELLRRADKQMIFAVTVIKYIDTHDELPQDRLDIVRQISIEADTDSPYSALDTLYHQILSTCGKWDRVQHVLRLLVTPHEPPHELRTRMGDGNVAWRSPAVIAHFLGVQEAQVQVTLDKLHSVLRVPKDGDEDDNSEYCELLVLFSLRTLSDLACHYPPYHINRFTEAMSLWEKKFTAMRRPLQDLVLRGWSLWREVTFPWSPDLIDALSTLDIYHFIALWFKFIRYRVSYTGDLKRVIHLEEQIKLAKSRGSMPHRFIERLEVFEGIEVLNLAFPPYSGGNYVFRGTWWAEQSFWQSQFYLMDIFLPRSGSGSFLVLPPDSSYYGMSIPEGWITVAVTKESSELELKLDDAIDWRTWLLGDKAGIFLEDVRNNTSYSISKGIVRVPIEGAPENSSGALSKAP